MPQFHHAQYGTFHVTTNAQDKKPWCTAPGIPDRLIENLCITKNLCEAKIHAFCILPNHMHIIVTPGSRGLSPFVQSFKTNSMKDIRYFLGKTIRTIVPADLSAPSAFGAASAIPATVNNDIVGNVRREMEYPIGWQSGFHDEHIRSADQRSACLAYIYGNAVRHRLVSNLLDWPWTSLHFEHLLDPMEVWFD